MFCVFLTSFLILISNSNFYRALLQFVEGHTDVNVQRLSGGDFALLTRSPIQELAVSLLIALQNDLVRRAMKVCSTQLHVVLSH